MVTCGLSSVSDASRYSVSGRSRLQRLLDADVLEDLLTRLLVSGATMPLISDTIRPPKNVSNSHAPNPISADVAARRMPTDSSIPNASHSET